MKGRWDPSFDDLAQAFAAGLEEYELGAAASLRIDGQEVLNLWGGQCDRKSAEPWLENSLCCVFSITKLFAALALLDAVAEGVLTLDEPASTWWTDLGENTWPAPTLRQLLAHQAGLVGCRTPLQPEDYYQKRVMIERLGREAPWWPAGTDHGYHARTYGLLLDELLQRASGESISERLRRRFGTGQRFDFHLGLGEEALARCVTLLPPTATPDELDALPGSTWRMLKAMANRQTPTGAAFQNPRLPRRFMNEARFRQAALASSSAHATAGALTALLEDCLQKMPASLRADAATVHSTGPDAVLLTESNFGLGFMLGTEAQPLGLGPATIGHVGSGGAVLFALPESRIYFSFLPNRMRPGVMHWGKTAEAMMRLVRERS